MSQQHTAVHDDDSGGRLPYCLGVARAHMSSADEYDHISTRSLALARYKRNHEYMNEVFMHAAFGKCHNITLQYEPPSTVFTPGDKKPKDPQDPYAIFNEDEIKEKTVRIFCSSSPSWD